MALVAAQAALEDQAYLREIVACIGDDCRQLRTSLSRFAQCHVYPSVTNFLYVRIHGAQAQALRTHLAANRILVRTRPDFPEHIRITSLLPEENHYLIEVVGRFFESPVTAAG